MPKRKRAVESKQAAADEKESKQTARPTKRRKVTTKDEPTLCPRCGDDPAFSCLLCFRRVFGDPKVAGKVNFMLDGEDLGWVDRADVHRLLDNWGIYRATYHTLAIALGLIKDINCQVAQTGGGCRHDAKNNAMCGDCVEKRVMQASAADLPLQGVVIPGKPGTGMGYKVPAFMFLGWRYANRVKGGCAVSWDEFAQDMIATGCAPECELPRDD